MFHKVQTVNVIVVAMVVNVVCFVCLCDVRVAACLAQGGSLFLLVRPCKCLVQARSCKLKLALKSLVR